MEIINEKNAENALKNNGFELEDVYHYMFRQSGFKAFELEEDDIIGEYEKIRDDLDYEFRVAQSQMWIAQ
mgnify:CR=1 FL=1